MFYMSETCQWNKLVFVLQTSNFFPFIEFSLKIQETIDEKCAESKAKKK